MMSLWRLDKLGNAYLSEGGIMPPFLAFGSIDLALVRELGFVIDDRDVWSTVERSSSMLAAATLEDTILIRAFLLL